MNDVIQTIKKTAGIQSVHDLHIWSITSGLNALSSHVVVNNKLTIAESEKMLRKIENDLEHKWIQHVTGAENQFPLSSKHLSLAR